MFTGLVETIGTVRSVEARGTGAVVSIEAQWPDSAPPGAGDSVAVNGACLTAVGPSGSGFTADISPETLQRTLLGELRQGAPVNLERALRLGSRLGGHLVQGHVDTVVRLLFVRPEGGFQRWRISLPAEHAREVAPKGSVCIHGVSLTVASLGDDWFEIALIPATLEATNLGRMRSGTLLHLETDVLAKYVARMTAAPERSSLEEMFGGGDGA
jgi:riboflavin synthase